jgi:hypothetical protein
MQVAAISFSPKQKWVGIEAERSKKRSVGMAEDRALPLGEYAPATEIHVCSCEPRCSWGWVVSYGRIRI